MISEQYKNWMTTLHQRKGMGAASKKPKGQTPLWRCPEVIEKYQPKTVLDFGCGQGGLIRDLSEMYPDIEFVGYDPGVPQFSQLPEDRQFDLIVSFDVIEHIEPDHLAENLQKLMKMGKNFYLDICTGPAKKKLPDGRNAHLIQESDEYWTPWMQHFGDIKEMYYEPKRPANLIYIIEGKNETE